MPLFGVLSLFCGFSVGLFGSRLGNFGLLAEKVHLSSSLDPSFCHQVQVRQTRGSFVNNEVHNFVNEGGVLCYVQLQVTSLIKLLFVLQ